MSCPAVKPAAVPPANSNLDATAKKAYMMANIHFNLITSKKPSTLSLTKKDAEIYEKFRKDFPELKVSVLIEDDLKGSKENQQKWLDFAKFCKEDLEMKDTEDMSLVRLNYSGLYSEDNVVFCVKAQYLAVEIARNKEGLNDELFEYVAKQRERALLQQRLKAAKSGNKGGCCSRC